MKKMRIDRQWLIVGITTLAAGVVTSIALENRPMAAIAASTFGAVGGVFLAGEPRSEGQTRDRLDRLETLLNDNIAQLSTVQDRLDRATSKGDRAVRKAAIFYDIENLLKGYNFSKKMPSSLSLQRIYQDIEKTGRFERVIAQKAYANWSDRRLNFMREELNHIGIDPVQVFGFSSEPTKNAADIQLVIDAIDLAYRSSSIDVFAIVSGDGGFASLAKQLHERGKTVIGCAYRTSASKTFQSVCDDFIWIADPTQGSASKSDRQISTEEKLQSESITTQTNGKSINSPKEILAITREILNGYARDEKHRIQLLENGIELTLVKQDISKRIPNLQTRQFGFGKFMKYLQYACQGLPLCVVRVSPKMVRLALRDSIPENATILPDLEARSANSVET